MLIPSKLTEAWAIWKAAVEAAGGRITVCWPEAAPTIFSGWPLLVNPRTVTCSMRDKPSLIATQTPVVKCRGMYLSTTSLIR
jgi:hypothetical protein